MLTALPRNTSLVAQATQAMRDALERGAFVGDLPGERKLCERLHVSRPTLRAALAQLAKEGRIAIAHGKPCRVLRPRAEPAAPPRQRMVLLSPMSAGEMPRFFGLMLDELRTRLSAANMPMELLVQPGAFSARPARVLENLVHGHPDAIWLLHLAVAPMQRWFHERGLPCVLAGTSVAGVALPSVDNDHRATCRHAAGTLIKAGRRRLALLLPEGARGGDDESETGFLEAISRSTLRVPPPRIVRHDATVAGVCQALDRLLNQRPKPDGLLVGRSIHALTALTHLLRRGVKIPADLSLLSRDDDAFLAHAIPAVARYASDPVKFAARLARIILQFAQGLHPSPRPQLLIPELIRGETLR